MKSRVGERFKSPYVSERKKCTLLFIVIILYIFSSVDEITIISLDLQAFKSTRNLLFDVKKNNI